MNLGVPPWVVCLRISPTSRKQSLSSARKRIPDVPNENKFGRSDRDPKKGLDIFSFGLDISCLGVCIPNVSVDPFLYLTYSRLQALLSCRAITISKRTLFYLRTKCPLFYPNAKDTTSRFVFEDCFARRNHLISSVSSKHFIDHSTVNLSLRRS